MSRRDDQRDELVRRVLAQRDKHREASVRYEAQEQELNRQLALADSAQKQADISTKLRDLSAKKEIVQSKLVVMIAAATALAELTLMNLKEPLKLEALNEFRRIKESESQKPNNYMRSDGFSGFWAKNIAPANSATAGLLEEVLRHLHHRLYDAPTLFEGAVVEGAAAGKKDDLRTPLLDPRRI